MGRLAVPRPLGHAKRPFCVDPSRGNGDSPLAVNDLSSRTADPGYAVSARTASAFGNANTEADSALQGKRTPRKTDEQRTR
jgi:hypothetical protein